MSFWSAIVLIVAIVAFAKMRGARFGVHVHDREQSRPPQVDESYTRELEREVADLRERVKVLERIATDGRDTKRLASEIESLRDS
ncbi:hypothetical protein RXV95_05235 [Novosphingobium sp. ZN18A2]|uniref:hypothetical protein n=1 Tax=Novosphingobium sp. ZN18A2 TaxID=3079861 RepID=UPI0030D5135A